MKLLFAINVPLLRAHGGANRSNRAILAAMAARGHEIRAISPLISTPPEQSVGEAINTLRQIDPTASEVQPGRWQTRVENIQVDLVDEPSRIRDVLRETIQQFQPDWVLISSEDPSHTLLATAIEFADDRVVVLAHTLTLLPFGPHAFFPGTSRTQLFHRARAVVAFSQFSARYIEEHGKIKAFIFHPPHYGAEPFPDLSSAPGPHVLLINPSALKGLPVFLQLAQTMPTTSFAVVPGYATTTEDLDQLRKQKNVCFLQPGPIVDVLRHAKVVLVPSLGPEAFGMIVVDAMLHGIPVITSNVGGLKEAALNAAFVLPVNPIERWQTTLDTNFLPQAFVPQQDILPWEAILSQLLTKPVQYQRAAAECRQAAHTFVRALSISPFEAWLLHLCTQRPPSISVEPVQIQPPALSAEERSAMIRRLRKQTTADANVENHNDSFRASCGQTAIWIFERLSPGTRAFMVPGQIRLSGKMDRTALQQALQALLNRHSALRSTFSTEADQLVQTVHHDVKLAITFTNLVHLSQPQQEQYLNRAIKDESETLFDLTKAPIFRAQLITLSPTEHVLLLSTHHLVCDGWSLGILLDDLVALYSALRDSSAATLPNIQNPYANYCIGQAKYLNERRAQRDLDYWREKLTNICPLQLPLDFALEKPPTTRAGSIPFDIPEKLATKLRKQIQQSRASLFSHLAAGFRSLLARWTGQSDIVIGTVVSGRHQSGFERTVGLFLNTLALRVEVPLTMSVDELCLREREVLSEALNHQSIPFEEVVRALRNHDVSTPDFLFRTLLIVHPPRNDTFQIEGTASESKREDGLRIQIIPSARVDTAFDLTLEITEGPQQFSGLMSYRSDVFAKDTITNLIQCYLAILAAIVDHPETTIEQLKLPAPSIPINPIQNAQTFLPVQAQFEKHARQQPDAIAIVDDAGLLSYAQLDRSVKALASQLAKSNVQAGAKVGILVGNETNLIVGMLAVLKQGACFACYDPEHPSVHTEKLLRAFSPAAVIVDAAHQARYQQQFRTSKIVVVLIADKMMLTDQNATPDHHIHVAGDMPAYVAFTSGSSGTPKGIVQSHRAFAQFIDWMATTFQIHPSRRIALWARRSYDAAYTEIFAALCTGATLLIAHPHTRFDPENLLPWLIESDVQIFQTVPSFCRELLQRIQARNALFPALQYMLLSGEVLSRKIATDWLEYFPKGTVLVNQYGPTECTLASWHPLTQESLRWPTIPIGKAISGRHISIRYTPEQLTPFGWFGEIFISSDYLANGYLNDLARTQEAFLPDPLGISTAMYRTGDFGRFLPDGNFEFRGRLDHEVKIRGVRVHLAEIERTLNRIEGVREGVIIAKKMDAQPEVRLFAFVVADTGKLAIEIRDAMTIQLPAAMIPDVIEILPNLPRTASNKVDRQALSQHEISAIPHTSAPTKPNTRLEISLTQIWGEVLARDPATISIDDRFFEIGGHSLLLMRLQREIELHLNKRVTLADLLAFPTIRLLTTHLNDEKQTETPTKREPGRLSLRRAQRKDKKS